MEADAEEQGEGDDAAEKVFDQPTQVYLKMKGECVIKCQIYRICARVFRRVRMRRWGTCSWLGRCWKSPKSFTKGNGNTAMIEDLFGY